MILELLIRLFFGIVNMILALIPSVTLPTGFEGMFADVAYLFSFGTYFLPVGTIVTCLTLIFLVDNIKFIMSIINWIIAKIPTIS